MLQGTRHLIPKSDLTIRNTAVMQKMKSPDKSICLTSKYSA